MNIKSKNTQEVMKKEWVVHSLGLPGAGLYRYSAIVGCELCSIDVAGAMEKPTDFRVGSDVRYVPLETTDSCLVGGSPNILLLDKEIVVFSRQTCFIFDKESGKFLSKVGHLGDDPEAYFNCRRLLIMM